jgi:hypothetical protein
MNNKTNLIPRAKLSKEDANELTYKKLAYFFENNLPIHFCIVDSPSWKNGYIKTINPKNHSFILTEFREGEIHLLFEEIYLASIKVYKTKEEMSTFENARIEKIEKTG